MPIDQSSNHIASAIKKGIAIMTMPLRLLRATRLPSNSRLPAVNIQAACTLL